MNEPYRKIYTIDETTGIGSSSPSDSLNIGTILISPTGPTERTTVTSQTDLLNKFLTGNAFSPNDDTTIQHVGSLVTDAPVDVIRVDSSILREGLTSTGLRVITDKDFNLIDYYTKVDFNSIIPELIPQIYAIIAYDHNTYCFYAGSEAPKLDESLGVPSQNMFKVVEDKSDAYGFLSSLNKSIINNLNVTDVNLILNTTEDSAIVVSGLINSLNGLTNYQKSIIQSTTVISSDKTSTEDPSPNYIVQGDYIKLGGYTLYYLGDGTTPTDSMINPIPIGTNLTDTTKVLVPSFLISVLNQIVGSPDLQNPIGVVGNYEFKMSLPEPSPGAESISIAVSYSDNLSKYFSKLDMIEMLGEEESQQSTYTGSKLIVGPSLDLIPAGYLTISMEGNQLSFWFGEQGNNIVPASVQSSGIQLGTNARIPQKFISDISDVIRNGGVSTLALNYVSTISNFTIFYQTENEPGLAAKSNNVIQISTNPVPTERISFATQSQSKLLQEYSDLFINMGEYTFYIGKLPDTARPNRIKLSASSLTINNFLDEVVNQGAAYYKLGKYDFGLLIQSDTSAGVNITATKGLISDNIITINQLTLTDKFAIIARFPSEKNLFNFSYIKNDNGSYQLTLSYKSDEVDYTISFDPDAVDGYGQSIYYTKVNDGSSASKFFNIIELPGDQDRSQYVSNNFGAYLTNPKVTSTNIIDAINKFAEYDDKHYTFFWDAGYTDPVVSRAFASLAEELSAEYVMSYPFHYKKKSEFKSYRDAVGINSFRGYSIIPSFRNSTLGTFLAKLSCSLSFLQLKIKNYNAISSEFAPCYGPNKGLITAPNLTVKLSKADREELLDSQINTVMTSTAGTQINFNTTMQKVNSYLSEEQNVQLTNTIVHVCDDYAETLIGEQNDSALWNKVVTELTEKLTQRVISNKSPAPAGLKVVMNAELNTTMIIESRKAVFQVWVQYTPSIAYVLGYTKVMRLGSF